MTTDNEAVNALLEYLTTDAADIAEIKQKLTYYNFFILGSTAPAAMTDEEFTSYYKKYTPTYIPYWTDENFISIQLSEDSSNVPLWKAWIYRPYSIDTSSGTAQELDLVTLSLTELNKVFSDAATAMGSVSMDKIKSRYYNYENDSELQKIASLFCSGKFVLYYKQYIISNIGDIMDPYTGETTKDLAQTTADGATYMFCLFCQILGTGIYKNSSYPNISCFWDSTPIYGSGTDSMPYISDEQTQLDINPFGSLTYMLHWLHTYGEFYQEQYGTAGEWSYKETWEAPFYYRIVFESDEAELEDTTIRAALKTELKEELEELQKSYEEKYQRFLEVLSQVDELSMCTSSVTISNAILMDSAGLNASASCAINSAVADSEDVTETADDDEDDDYNSQTTTYTSSSGLTNEQLYIILGAVGGVIVLILLVLVVVMVMKKQPPRIPSAPAPKAVESKPPEKPAAKTANDKPPANDKQQPAKKEEPKQQQKPQEQKPQKEQPKNEKPPADNKKNEKPPADNKKNDKQPADKKQA